MTHRTLLLVRHAKAKKATRELSRLTDLARPLTRRGRNDARTMGKRLARRGVQPDLVWSSPARRALETARLLAKKLGYKRKDIRVDPRLYATSAARLRLLVRELNHRLECVLLCGHNPELERFALRLGATLEALPTCGIVELKFGVRSWTAVGEPTLIAARFDRPRRPRITDERS